MNLINKFKNSSYGIFLEDIFKYKKLQIIMLVFLMSLNGVFEGATIVLFLPLLTKAGIATGTSTVSSQSFLAKQIEIISVGQTTRELAVIIGFVAAIQMVLYIGQSWWVARLVHKYTTDWQKRLFDGFLTAKWIFHHDKKAGSLSNFIVTETKRLTGAFHILMALASFTLVTVSYVVMAILLSWQATLIVLGFCFLVTFLLAKLFSATKKIGEKTGPLNAELQIIVSECLSNIKIIKTTQTKNSFYEKYKKIIDSIEVYTRKAVFLPQLVKAIFEFSIIVSFVLLLSIYFKPANLQPAEFMVILALFVRLVPRFISIQTMCHNLNNYVAAIVDIKSIWKQTTNLKEKYVKTSFLNAPVLPCILKLKNLDFSFGDKKIFNALTKEFMFPSFIGIVGESGVGKSTLIHLLLGLLEPRAGEIAFGSTKQSEVSPEKWRKLFGYVPQETCLFHASIEENIALAKNFVPRHEIVKAAKKAGAHGFIEESEMGYSTIIGDQGSRVSGGQRQRIAIARALISNPLCLIMDEPTSSLDEKNERELNMTLQELSKTMGIIVISHRESTLKNADIVWNLRNETSRTC